MEKVKASKRRSFHRCYKKTFANCVGVDAKRNSDDAR